MKINALGAQQILAQPEQRNSPPSQAVEQFLHHLALSPEQRMVAAVQQGQRVLVEGMAAIPFGQRITPQQALDAQTALAGSVVGIDMVAKVAGSFSQALNKLVSMQ
ncbi:type III secretion system inner rod subunit SctI [Serratia quinivorans]|uniref:type III secretion system inner rod subunit SctI n=1 Tax=Serratia quinivorans TaxID=137545 RepID=UPI00217978AC|nr:type III secretion system inner rod subunit SctI [Serratia quinivorans]CAI1009799.1 type III secretion system protein SsaI [Serratia quinivorans]CAI1810231.1 type III secretion system protein SsaI [Serratia quinivorans]